MLSCSHYINIRLCCVWLSAATVSAVGELAVGSEARGKLETDSGVNGARQVQAWTTGYGSKRHHLLGPRRRPGGLDRPAGLARIGNRTAPLSDSRAISMSYAPPDHCWKQYNRCLVPHSDPLNRPVLVQFPFVALFLPS